MAQIVIPLSNALYFIPGYRIGQWWRLNNIPAASLYKCLQKSVCMVI